MSVPFHGWKTMESAPKRVLVDLFVEADEARFGPQSGPYREPDCYYHRSAWRTWERGRVIKKSRVLFWRHVPRSPYDPYPGPDEGSA